MNPGQERRIPVLRSIQLGASLLVSGIGELGSCFGPLRLWTACLSRYSICPFTLRNSSLAQDSSSAQSSGSIRNRKGFRSAMNQVYSVPAFTTGCTSDSPHNTTIRLLTMAARRSSSR